MEAIVERAIFYRQMAITMFKRVEMPVMYVLKFFLGIFVFSSINSFFSDLGTSYATRLDRLPVILLAAIITAILPSTWVFMLMWLFITLHIYYISLELAVILGALLLCLIFFYIRIFPKESWLIILLLVCFKLKIPFFVPLFAGLFVGIGSAGALIIGSLIWSLIPQTAVFSTPGSNLSEIDLMSNLLTLPQVFGDALKSVIEILSSNDKWVYTSLVFVASMIAVWVVSRLSIPYSMEAALGVGGLALLIGTLIGGAGSMEGSVLGSFFSIIFSLILAFICKFFYIVVNYTGTERVTFQDDDYLYYVKAVPKIK